MKSIVEEASSISKAIENGWNRADKPKEFTVKILEEPERNFWGMTIKKAKIAFLYQNKNETNQPNSTRQRDNRAPKNINECISNEKNTQQKVRKQDEAITKNDLLPKKKREITPSQPLPETIQEKNTDIWNQEMIALVNEWIEQLLIWMNASNVSFVCEPAGTRLKVTFNKTFVADPTQEKQLFVNAAHLAVEMIRNRLKKHIRNLHIQFFIAR